MYYVIYDIIYYIIFILTSSSFKSPNCINMYQFQRQHQATWWFADFRPEECIEPCYLSLDESLQWLWAWSSGLERWTPARQACNPSNLAHKRCHDTTKNSKLTVSYSSAYSDLFYPVLNLNGLSLSFDKQNSSFRTLSGQPWSASATLIRVGATKAQQQALISFGSSEQRAEWSDALVRQGCRHVDVIHLAEKWIQQWTCASTNEELGNMATTSPAFATWKTQS